MRYCVLDAHESDETQNFEITGYFSDCSDSMCEEKLQETLRRTDTSIRREMNGIHMERKSPMCRDTKDGQQFAGIGSEAANASSGEYDNYDFIGEHRRTSTATRG